ncbi:response regulator [Runella sp.]|uniref:response regulator n=1 Tax=Runella sp. TaxID=1960881 RepID=UPI003D0B3016
MSMLLIADDHRLFADGLRFIIDYATEYQLAGVVHTGKEVVPFLKNRKVDVLLLDVDLPDKSGSEVAKEVRIECPWVKILAISMLNDYDSVQMMLGAGATGYCLKSAGKDELFAALAAVSQGEVYVSPSLFPVMMNGQTEQKTHFKNPLHELTNREIEVVRAFASGKSVNEIAESLFLSKHTVESHRKNIYAKLDLHSISELMVFVRKNGLL